MANGQQEAVEKWEDEPETSALEIHKDVSQRDIFKLGKYVLIGCGVLYITAAGFRVFNGSEGAKEVWDYSKVALNSIVSLVIGAYFGSRGRGK